MKLTELMGRTAIFDPFACDKGQAVKELSCTVKGKVVYVNHKHEWFSVKYGDLRTSFAFSEIGKEVQIL